MTFGVFLDFSDYICLTLPTPKPAKMNRVLLLIVCCCIFPCLLPSQIERGVHPANPREQPAQTGVRRAVVIGISDYADPAITDLQYAHKDAEAFAQWLQSPAGGALPQDNIRVLLNQQATIGNMYQELEWLVESSREGDQAVIYFSGHGDVESRTRKKEGFLLCYNSPPNNYRTNAFAVYWLQDIIERLSIDKKAKVIVITDACRAGKLAGHEINGSQLTSAALMEQFAGEIKILSCQPNEYSVEGREWGGGRGVFSYHLLSALYGLADRDENNRVQLRELSRYLEDNVPAQAAPIPQNPLVVGDREAVVALVDTDELMAYQENKQSEDSALLPTEMKGYEAMLLASADSNIQAVYAAFQACLARKELLTAPDSGKCANDYYEILVAAPEMAPMAGLIQRNFVAALIDEGQTVINKILKTDPATIDNLWRRKNSWNHIPSYLHRAAELLGDKHYMYSSLKAKEYWFEVVSFSQSRYPNVPVDSISAYQKNMVIKGLNFEPDAPFLILELAKASPKDSLPVFETRLKQVAPNWALWYYDFGIMYSTWRDRSESISYYAEAIRLDSQFIAPYFSLAWRLDDTRKPDEARRCREAAINIVYRKWAADSNAVTVYEYNTIGNALWGLRRYAEAEQVLLAGERKMGKPDVALTSNLSVTYCDMGQFDRVKEVIDRFPKQYWVSWWTTVQYYYLNDTLGALNLLENGLTKEYLRKDDKNDLLYQLAVINRQSGQYEKALEYLQRIEEPWEEIRLARGDVLIRLGRVEEANVAYDSLLADQLLVYLTHEFNIPNWFFQIVGQHRTGAYDLVLKGIEEVQSHLADDPNAQYWLACVFAQIGRLDEAMQSLLRAEKLGWLPNPVLWVNMTIKDPKLDPLRHLPEFQAWEKRWAPPYKDFSVR